jgi:hypothetical protein
LNFSDFPKSLTEIAADKSEDCRKWTPRDLLISLLRQIDSKEIAPTAMIVCYEQMDEDGEGQEFVSLSGVSRTHAIGMLTTASAVMAVGD